MKSILLLLFVFITTEAFSQKKLFDTLKVDATTKIIGRYPQYDNNRTYERYNFIIEDPTQIKKFISVLKLGEEVDNATEDMGFELTVVKNHQEIGSWTVSPALKSAMTHDGHTYKFDLSQIVKLHEKYPFEYSFQTKAFNTKNEYEAYLASQKRNSHFLFDYSPMFKYEGSFEIQFKKSTKFPNPKAISDYLTPYIEKIVNENEYRLSYILDDKNMADPGQYTMTISGPKRLFNELKPDGVKSENWKPTVEEAYFFYKR